MTAGSRSVQAFRPVRLRQGAWCVPNTDALFDEVARLYAAPDHDEFIFYHFSGPLRAFACELSMRMAVAYIETEYFGGVGGQAAAAWSGGLPIMAPTAGPIGPINAALRAIGIDLTVAEEPRHPFGVRPIDEFEAIGLQGFRSMDDFDDSSDSREHATGRGPVA